jgi:phosphatidylserine/phosphatidylglycerophosphate/cardiolipin synthase-like enzyme
MYNSNRPDIITALKQAQQRGVRIRYIGDADQSNSALDPLPGFPVMFRSGAGIMHHKFIVADSHDPDRAVVWAGSTNHSTNQLSWDPNNALVIRDQALAKAYLHEFEEMWGGGDVLPNSILSRTGDEKLDDTPHLFSIGGRHVEVYFSPSDQTNSQILEEIESAETTIDVALLLLTRNDLTSTLVSKSQEGVAVRVIVNDIESSANTFQTLVNGGVPVAEHTLNPIFHHKYAIIDEGFDNAHVLTGSHNWTTSATTINDENMLVIFDLDLANMYRQEFEARWTELVPTNTTELDSEAITISPNPVADMIIVQADRPIESLKVSSLMGQIVVINKHVNSMDVSNLNPGYYFLHIQLSPGRQIVLPFVKSL